MSIFKLKKKPKNKTKKPLNIQNVCLHFECFPFFECLAELIRLLHVAVNEVHTSEGKTVNLLDSVIFQLNEFRGLPLPNDPVCM